MKSNTEWRYWGRRDPLWSVASWPGKEVGGPTPWTPEEFLALGASDFRDISHHWRHYGMQAGVCVEIGCGAGRMTAQLVTAFDRVVALDVSADQIQLARELLGSRSSGVSFHQVEGAAIPLADGTCAAMFSCHVFQHFSDFGGILAYLRETFRVLAPGGTICFHIPVPGAHRGSAISATRMALYNLSVSLRRFLGLHQVMEYHRYDPKVIFGALTAIGFRDPELRIFDMTSNRDPHSFFLARKP